MLDCQGGMSRQMTVALPNLGKHQNKTDVKCPTWANAKTKRMLNAQPEQTSQQMTAALLNLSKRQSLIAKAEHDESCPYGSRHAIFW